MTDCTCPSPRHLVALAVAGEAERCPVHSPEPMATPSMALNDGASAARRLVGEAIGDFGMFVGGDLPPAA